MDGEMRRQQGTRLVARLRGGVELTEKLPPADVQRAVNDYLSTLAAGIQAFEGVVETFTADGLAATFGAAPHERREHALWALVCATELRLRHQAWRQGQPHGPELSIGLATGALLWGPIGPPGREQPSSLGPTARLAARLSSAAKGGQILLTPDVHRAAAHVIDGWDGPIPLPRMAFESMGTRKLEGVHGNVQIVQVRLKSRDVFKPS